YEEAMEYFSRTQTPRPVVYAKWGIARAQFFLGKYPEALTILQNTLAAAKYHELDSVVAQCHEYLGQTYAAMNDQVKALEHFETALVMYEDLVNPMEKARVWALNRKVYQTQGKLDEAKKFFQPALKTFDALNDHIDRSATLFAMGQVE